MLFQIAHFTIDTELLQLWESEVQIAASPRVARFIAYLVEHQDRICTRRELIEAIWPDTAVGEDSLDRCASDARSLLRDKVSAQPVIGTFRRRGYRVMVTCNPIIRAPARWVTARPNGGTVPAVTCLPLDCSPELGELGHGMSHELTTRLTRWRVIPVIARDSAFAFAPTAAAKEVGCALGALYVIAGDV